METLEQYGQATASQIQRLHFADGSPASQGVRMRRTMIRLTVRGHVSRLTSRGVGGTGGGSQGYVYQAARARGRNPDVHTLDISELGVRLHEANRAGVLQLVEAQPEPDCHMDVGGIALEPDLWVRIRVQDRGRRCFVELDRATESAAEISRKLDRYAQAYERWGEGAFPLVLFVVNHELPARLTQRVQLIQRAVEKHSYGTLFRACALDGAIAALVS